jgi:hypothetical protein
VKWLCELIEHWDLNATFLMRIFSYMKICLKLISKTTSLCSSVPKCLTQCNAYI